MMARMFKPPKSAPRPAENKAVHAKERKTAATRLRIRRKPRKRALSKVSL